MSEIKLCVNCKFIDCKHNMKFARCNVPIGTKQDLVSGEVVTTTLYCETHRNQGANHCCGPDAKWYEPKPIGFFGSLLKRFAK